ncbi:MAG TPA: hypothetical protein PLJ35_02855 [Anaerolineae bacterium]|nr:hypothetical protein [Anaerolineae bacterium]HOQ97742.1 hypothetical protein [Anaerolineae bacterium]HPL27284.1 hypothetical protein [Anaerolineae bacterium]
MNSTRQRIAAAALAAALVAIALLSAGCDLPAVAAQAGPRDPFTARIQGGEGLVVELKGLAHGHRAGSTARFELALRNDGTKPWQGRYCLTLVGRSLPVATLAAGELNLEPGVGEAYTIEAPLPADLAAGCYGLALVLPERLASVTTITVGEGAEPCSESWPAPACP